jgi:hypothetical protein
VRGEAIIGVLDDEITGAARKRPILDLALCAGTDANHIAHFRKMVGSHGALRPFTRPDFN